jgi:hypothetical protein
MSTAQLPLAEPRSLWRFRNRTRIVRLALAVALVATAVAAFLLSRGGTVPATPLLGTDSRGIIVLDLSASVENATLAQMHTTLQRFAASKGNYGLVIFSDQAYQALPPGTPANQLAPYAAFFRRGVTGAAEGPSGAPLTLSSYPPNPWSTGFSLGTQISTGLTLARTLILSYHLQHKDVWLLSDLGDEASDLPLVTAAAKQYEASGIALHLVPVNPLKYDLHFFQKLNIPGTATPVTPVKPKGGSHRHFPIGLAILGVILAALLAVNELWSRPLEWKGSAVPE